MNINWHNIRSINGDQREGFEELTTQLARKEIIQNQSRFIRKGKPDAGVECLWLFEDGTEWAWQAKYFTSSLGGSQWQQLDDSVKTIIDKHKQVKKYFIAIPLDPADARTDGKSSMLEKWETHVEKWEKCAKDEKLSIEFIPWWHSDLIARLQRSENAGFILFWFDKQSFTDGWFKEKLEIATKNLGSRYTPEVNYKLDVVKIFDGIARDDKFHKQIYEKLDNLIVGLKKYPNNKDEILSACIKNLHERCDVLAHEYINIVTIKENEYDFDVIRSIVAEISTIIEDVEKRTNEIENNDEKEQKDKLEYSKYHIRRAYALLAEFEHFINSLTIELFNKPYLLLEGEAGIGKSHLLADVARTRSEENKYSLLLLGQQFNDRDVPQKQILNQLDLTCSFDEFLEALNCKAQISGTRLIIFIDAINEGSGKALWPEHINGFISIFSKYSWIGLVFSVRSSYVKLFEDNITYLAGTLFTHVHYGFRNVEYQASKIFFKNYKIELPNTPILHTEFQNPLFLKLFCEGLKIEGCTKIPDGLEGLTHIFDFFVASINKRLAKPSKFDFSSSINIVKKVIYQLVKYKANNKLLYLPLENVARIVASIQREFGILGNLTDALIAEGVLSKNLFINNDDSYEEGIYISYERFEDHLIVAEIFEDISKDKIINEFDEGGVLYNFTKDEDAINTNRGIVEALSIQLPERYSFELFEAVGDLKNCYEIAEAFVSSLLWRKSDSIVETRISDYINDTVLKYEGTSNFFFDTLIALSTKPNHCLNALRTHEVLIKLSLSQRDSWWTQVIHGWYSDERSMKRLIDWAWSIEGKNHISDESIELVAVMLTWFLVSTNRRVRDSATKALVCLLQSRIYLVISLLRKFENVNDPYVYERIYAVAYGCALRTRETEDLKELSEYIYETIFNKDKVYPQVLLRDYARGVIEHTLYIGLKPAINDKKICPPYKSDFPTIPTDVEVGKYTANLEDKHHGVYSILRSMEVERTRGGKVALYGDFGRYVFQSKFRDWAQLSPVDLKNIAIMRIFDLGYDQDSHGEFDRTVHNSGRHYVAAERIGKKYQWIALHELLAQVSDKYKMKEPWVWNGDKESVWFSGPWEPFIRDIDPSTIQRIDENVVVRISSKMKYDKWGIDNKEWLMDVSDLPEPKYIISDDSQEWILLDGYFVSSEEKLLGNELYSIPQKQFWYIIKSYIVPVEHYDKIYSWLCNADFMGRWMPEYSDRYEIFNREYYWSPAFDYYRKGYYNGEEVSTIKDSDNDLEIGEVIITANSYLWETGYDLSKDEAFRLLKPCAKIVNELKLSYGSNNESYMYSDTGELVCFDNSEGGTGQACLYFKKNLFKEYLNKAGYKIIWTVLGEKNIIADHYRDGFGSWPTVSGVYSMVDGEIIGSIKQYR